MFKEALAGPPVHRGRITPHRGCHMRNRLGSECAPAYQHHARTTQQKAVQQKPRRHAARLSPALPPGARTGTCTGVRNEGKNAREIEHVRDRKNEELTRQSTDTRQPVIWPEHDPITNRRD